MIQEAEDVIARAQERGLFVHRHAFGRDMLINAYQQEDADWLHELGFSAKPYEPEPKGNPERVAWECCASEKQFAPEESVVT